MARYNEEPLRPRMSIAQAAAWVNPVSGEEAEDVTVRRAAAADAEVICGFLKDLRDEQAKKRPDVVDKNEDILTLEETAAAIDDPSKLIFVAENVDGKVVGHILCELEGMMEIVESAAEAAASVPAAPEPAMEAPEEAAKEAAEAVEEAAAAAEETVETAAEALPAQKKTLTAEKLVIANIYVEDPVRRQRIGTQLYHEARRAAKELGCTAAELSCWQFDKEGIGFFEKLGYRPLLVTMEKELED